MFNFLKCSTVYSFPEKQDYTYLYNQITKERYLISNSKLAEAENYYQNSNIQRIARKIKILPDNCIFTNKDINESCFIQNIENLTKLEI